MGKTNKKLGIQDQSFFERIIEVIRQRKIGDKLLNKCMIGIIKIFERIFRNKAITYHIRPLENSNFHIKPSKKSNSTTAIVMQGPVDNDKDFTLETLKIYRKLYRDSLIILSTWDNENKEILNQIENIGVKIIQSRKPDNTSDGPLSTWQNIDLQIISTKAGLKFALKNNAEYCLKTRTDQRFYRSDLIDYFFKFQETFPLNAKTNQNQRLISSSFATPKYRVYGLTDMMMFGEVNDLFNYWNVENYSTGIYKLIDQHSQDIPPIISGTLVGAEVYFMSSYLQKLDEDLDWTLEHYWEMLGEYFLIMDSTSIDTYWNKYNKSSEYKFGRDYSLKAHRLLDFMDWIQLYQEKDTQWERLRGQERWARSNGQLVRSVI